MKNSKKTLKLKPGSKFKIIVESKQQDMVVQSATVLDRPDLLVFDERGACCNRRSAMVKLHESEEDKETREKFRFAPVIFSGDSVEIDGCSFELFLERGFAWFVPVKEGVLESFLREQEQLVSCLCDMLGPLPGIVESSEK